MERYQDYVIKDGKLIGKFEEMYQKFDDPWHQKECLDYSYIRHVTNVSIRKYEINSLLEVGCGLGAFTNFMVKNNPLVNVEGIDVSETAIQKARISYPDINFKVGDLLEYSEKKLDYDAILFSEIMWFILQDIDNIINNLRHNFSGKLIIVNQTFYKNGIQEYGKEYFTSLDEMCRYLSWHCLEKIVEERPASDSMGTHVVFRV